jgi:PAS domain S-box-containing protein
LFQHAHEGILVLRADGQILAANIEAEKMFRYSKGMLVGQNALVLVPKYSIEAYKTFLLNFQKTPLAVVMDDKKCFFASCQDLSVFPVVMHLKPLLDKHELRAVLFIHDMSRRHREEEVFLIQKAQLEQVNTRLEIIVKDRTMVLLKALQELTKKREELKQALSKEKELNDLKSRFVSMASHEFRTPLATILSSVSLVANYVDMSNKDKHAKHIARIRTAIKTLTEILDRTLSISKLEEGKVIVKPMEFNFPQLAASVIEDLQSTTSNDIMIVYKHVGSNDVVLDPHLLKHMLFNLGSNAIKYAGDSKTIRIESEIAGNRLQLSVRDKGIGISSEDQKHLFSRFFRAQNAINLQGTGLGVALP